MFTYLCYLENYYLQFLLFCKKKEEKFVLCSKTLERIELCFHNIQELSCMNKYSLMLPYGPMQVSKCLVYEFSLKQKNLSRSGTCAL